MDNLMNEENEDKKQEDDNDYHLYPYSYERNDGDKIHTIPESEKPETDGGFGGSTSEENVTVTGENNSIPVNDAQSTVSSDTEKKEIPASEIKITENTAVPEDPAPRKKSRKWQYLAIAMAFLFVIGVSFALIYQSINGELYSSGGKVAVIYVQGTLVTSSVPSGLGYVSSEEISDNIRKALRDENVKAIVLRVNSGGGSSTAGEEVYTEVKKASDSGVPVVVSMGDTAASAAYHLSSPADLIVANPSTMTGSIGTIWTFQNLSGYYDEEGVEYYIVKSGEFKDMGGSWRGLSDEEKEYANKVVAEVYGNFVSDVAEARGMSVSEVKSLADGRIYTGTEAQKLGLVDELGDFYDAIDMAADLGGIEGDPTIVYMNKPSISSLLFGSSSNDTGSATEEFLRYYEESPYGQIE